MQNLDTRKFEQVIRYIASALILIVAIIEILKIIGVEHSMQYDILKALVMIGAGLFIGFYKRPET